MVSSTETITRTSWTELERLLQEAARGFGCPRGYAKEFARVATWSECIFPGFLRHKFPDRQLFSDLSAPPLHNMKIENEPILVVVNRLPGFWLRFGPGLVDVAIARKKFVPRIRLIILGDTDIEAFWYSLSRLRGKGYETTTLINGYTDRVPVSSMSSLESKPNPFVENEVGAVARSQVVRGTRAITDCVKHRYRVNESSRAISISIDGTNESRGSNIWVENEKEDRKESPMLVKFEDTVVGRKLEESIKVGFGIEVSNLQAVREAAGTFLVNDGEGSQNNAG